MKVYNTKIDKNSKTFIIAEMSANHGGKLSKALEIIAKAKEAGADAIKIQTYRADTITLDCDGEDFLIKGKNPWSDYKNLYNLYKAAYTPWKWHEKLFREAKKNDIILFSTPFDRTAVKFLEQLDCQLTK